MNEKLISNIIEASLFSSSKPVSVNTLKMSCLADFKLTKKEIEKYLSELQTKYQESGIELVKLASGYRFQTKAGLMEWVHQLNQEKPPKYSRAILETLALIAYKQPITRGEIEEIRGVSIGSHIIRTLQDRNWIKTVGHKEVAGRPALFATTSSFLDYFGLQCIADLPTIGEDELQTKLTESLSDSGESDVRKNSKNSS